MSGTTSRLPAAAVPSVVAALLPILAAIFFIFLVVGLEIRREAHNGALATLKLAALPVAAAAGGVLAPALIYLGISRDTAHVGGWAVPTAVSCEAWSHCWSAAPPT